MKYSNTTLCCIFLLLLFSAPLQAAPIVDNWDAIRAAFFNNRKVDDAAEKITIKAPSQAEDAALVPFAFSVDLQREQIDKLYVFTDANPILLTATFTMKVPQPTFNVSTRIRLEKNSVVRVIALTKTGRLLMKTASIKTPGGGCGGGAMTDEAKLRASAGRMKMRYIEDNKDLGSSFVLRIRHPMRTGFERTFQGYYAKAWFIENIDFSINYHPYFNALLGPGISADPYFRFDLPDVKVETFQAEAKDNEGKVFQQVFQPESS